jgi:glycosyltransferase involved in cell wall biosynthesis
VSVSHKKTDILFVIPNLNGGGAERVFINYIRALDSHRFNIKLLLIEKIGVFLELVPPNVEIFDLGKKRTRFSFFKLLKLVKQINPRVIVSTTNRMNILVLMVSLFLSKQIKIVIREPNMPSAQFGRKYFPCYYLWLIKMLYPCADKIIAQTEAMKDDISTFFNIPYDKICVLINPVDIDLINEKLNYADNPFDEKNINILASGRISKQKGFDFLISAFSKVVNRDNRFYLYILGKEADDGSHKRMLVDLIQELGLEKNVVFIGFKNNPFPYYKYADLFVLSSRWEGFPNVVLEALYLKTPVIVTNCIPFFSGVIEEGKNSFIVKFGDENAMANRILEYDKLHVEKEYYNSQDLNCLFESMAI